jgi:hypothetical protein
MNIYVDYHDMLDNCIVTITIFSIDSIVQFLNKVVICENKKKQKINKKRRRRENGRRNGSLTVVVLLALCVLFYN